MKVNRLHISNKPMAARSGWVKLLTIAFLCLTTSLFAFADHAGAATVTFINNGTGSGTIYVRPGGGAPQPVTLNPPGGSGTVIDPVDVNWIIENPAPGSGSYFKELTPNASASARLIENVSSTQWTLHPAMDGDIIYVNFELNNAPAAADDSLGTNEDTPLIITVAGDILVNDSDVDGHVLSVTAFDGTSTNGGTVVDNGDGTWTYTPALNFNGLDSFGYTVGDGQTPELTDTATVSITVGAVNDAPVAADDSLGTNEDTPLIITVAGDILVNDSDVDGHVLSVTAFDGTSTNGGTVVDNGDGTWTYTPALNFNGLDSFGYTVGDGQTPELTDTATVSITVGAVNDAPVAADDSLGTNEDTPLIITVAGDILVNDSDVDGHVLSVTAFDGTSTNGGTVVDNGDGTWTYTPALNFNGLDSFGYTVGDGQTPELTDTATVSITVGAVNDAPVAADDSLGTNEDTPLIITVAGDILVNDSDVDGHVLSVTAFDGTSTNGGTVVDNGDGTWTYTPAPNFNGSDSFGYTVGDGQTPELTDTATVSITVGAVNDAPVAADDAWAPMRTRR